MVTGSYVSIDGTRAFVESSGDGAPVLCLHTAGQNALQWRHVLEELPRFGYRAIAPDLPGHGRSMPAANGPVHDLTVYAGWCLELVDQLGFPRPFVVGCSIGGKIALEMAARAGERLAGVVACACDAYNDVLSASGLARSLEESGSPSSSDRTYLGTLAAVGRDIDGARAELIGTLHRREDPVVTTCDLIGWASHDLRGALDQLACPALMVAGQDDFWIDADDVRRVAEGIPRGAFKLLPRVGHYPMEELPDFTAQLSDWLSELAHL